MERLPAKLDDREVPYKLEGHHWANLNRADGFDQIVTAIRMHSRK